MPVKPVHREQIKAIATGNAARAGELNEALPAHERAAFNKYLSAVFAVLLGEYFKDDFSREAIAAFAAETVRDLEGTDLDIDPGPIEGVIRAAAGEREIIEALSGDDILSTQLLVVGKIVMQDPDATENLDQYLDDAAQVYDEWELQGL